MGRKYYKPKKYGHYPRGGGLATALLSVLAGRRGHYAAPHHRPYRPSVKQSLVNYVLKRLLRKFFR